MKNTIKKRIGESIDVKRKIMDSEELMDIISHVQLLLTRTFKEGRKVLFCGNGGSAADAQHLAAELSGRFYKNRAPLYAEALHCNSSYLTAVANDFSFDDVYSRLTEAEGKPGDVLIAISTSGNSKNILNAADMAEKKGMMIVGLTGDTGGKLKDKCHYLINVPSEDTARIQEAHILIGHIICEEVESNLFPAKKISSTITSNALS